MVTCDDMLHSPIICMKNIKMYGDSYGDMSLYNVKSHETHINSSFINKMTITNILCAHPFFRWHIAAASATIQFCL